MKTQELMKTIKTCIFQCYLSLPSWNLSICMARKIT